MARRLLFLALLMAIALPLPTQAAQPALDLTGGVLSFTGDITPELLAVFRKVPWERVRLVRVHSDGGHIESSIALGKLLASKGVTVRVHDSCSSACLNLLIAGTNTTVEPGTIVLLHQSISGQYALISTHYPRLAEARRREVLEEVNWLKQNRVDPDLLLFSEVLIHPVCISAPKDDASAASKLKIIYRFQVWAPRDETLRRFGLKLNGWKQSPALVASEMAERYPQADPRQMRNGDEPAWVASSHSAVMNVFKSMPPCR